MRVIGVKQPVSEAIVKKILRKHNSSLDNKVVDRLAQSICNGNAVLDEDWALEQDLKDIGIRIA